MPDSRTLEVRPGRINKKLELHYDYDVKGMILNYYSVYKVGLLQTAHSWAKCCVVICIQLCLRDMVLFDGCMYDVVLFVID